MRTRDAADVILTANARIREEIRKIPKAKTGPQKFKPAHGKKSVGREATGIPHTIVLPQAGRGMWRAYPVDESSPCAGTAN
jgi:hypothetical protein